MFNIVAKLDRKLSDGNYGSVTCGVILTQEGLELKSADEVAAAADSLFRLAKDALDRQANGGTAAKTPAPQPEPSTGNRSADNGHAAATTGNGHGNGTGNGRKSYGRPKPGTEPSPRQKAFLVSLCKSRGLPAETVREICERVAGCRLEQLDRKGFSLLLKNLVEVAAVR